MTEEDRLDRETAQAEAGVVKSVGVPQAEDSIRRIADAKGHEKLKQALPGLGDTAYLELGSEVINQIRKENPGLYNALITRERAFTGLVDALYPEYVDIKQTHYTSPAKRRILAAKQPQKVREEATKKAVRTARSLVGFVVSAAEKAIKAAPSRHVESRDFVAVSRAVQDEIEEGHVIGGDNPEAIAALIGCSLASLEANRREKSMRLGFDVGPASKKQDKFDASQKK